VNYGEKILVVDDEPYVVKYLTAFLQVSGYRACSASDDEKALEA